MKTNIKLRLEDVAPQLSKKEVEMLEDIITTARVTGEPQQAEFTTAGVVTFRLAVIGNGNLFKLPLDKDVCETCGKEK